jgi:hypothetical protein
MRHGGRGRQPSFRSGPCGRATDGQPVSALYAVEALQVRYSQLRVPFPREIGGWGRTPRVGQC